MFRARTELLVLELQAAWASVTRLAAALIVGSLSALVAISVGTVALSSQLARWFDLDPLTLLWIFTAVATIVGAGLIIGGWRRYRREFDGLRDSTAELREDIIWLREWLETEATGDNDPSDDEEALESASDTAEMAGDNDKEA